MARRHLAPSRLIHGVVTQVQQRWLHRGGWTIDPHDAGSVSILDGTVGVEDLSTVFVGGTGRDSDGMGLIVALSRVGMW